MGAEAVRQKLRKLHAVDISGFVFGQDIHIQPKFADELPAIAARPAIRAFQAGYGNGFELAMTFGYGLNYSGALRAN